MNGLKDTAANGAAANQTQVHVLHIKGGQNAGKWGRGQFLFRSLDGGRIVI
jgi:hypothetical protein